MKHFVIEVNYTASAERIAELLSEHRAFLQIGYERGWLLASGPRVPKTGGIIVARAPSVDDLRAFFEADPYQINDAAEYIFIEFEPVKRQPFLEEWIA